MFRVLMQRLSGAAVLCAGLSLSAMSPLSPLPGVAASADMELGTNLSPVTYYNTFPVFNNLMNQAKDWTLVPVQGGQRINGDVRGLYPARGDGYPLEVPFTLNGQDHRVQTLIPVFEDGVHRVRVRGTGRVSLRGPGFRETWEVDGLFDAEVEVQGSRDLAGFGTAANLTEARNSPSVMTLEILESDASNPVRAVRIFRPDTTFGQVLAFSSEFLELLEPYSVLRAMKWTNLDANGPARWSERPRTWGYSMATEAGVPFELMIDLANQLDQDLWLTVPSLADANMITKLAELTRDELKPGLRVYLEYANEVWVPSMASYAFVNDNYEGDNVWQKYGARSAEVFEEWHRVFDADPSRGTADERLVCVLAGQAVRVEVLENALQTAGPHVDALGIAPYFGTRFFVTEGDRPSNIPPFPDNDAAVLDLLASDTYNRINGGVRDAVRDHRALADQAGVDLVCYEGGQSYVGVRNARNVPALTDALLSLNRSWHMRNLYRYRYLPMLDREGISLLCHFADAGPAWGRFGSWNAVEYVGQPVSRRPGDAVKAWALQDWLSSQ